MKTREVASIIVFLFVALSWFAVELNKKAGEEKAATEYTQNIEG
jgi:hypothetical protein